jgi:peptide-methionine (S)-S-oxide reductase
MAIYTFQLFAFLVMSAMLACNPVQSSTVNTLPTPSPDGRTLNVKGEQTAVFAGGCFWGVEAVFEHVKGVVSVRSGYSGGNKAAADYESVSGGKSGHAESVQVTFDPTKVTYEQLLSVFFTVAHDPTQLNFQGPDHGTQYRSAIFYVDEEQKKAALAYIAGIEGEKTYSKPVVTQVVPLDAFYEAEEYHQDYLARHPDELYIVINDKPKVEALKKKFPALYAGK